MSHVVEDPEIPDAVIDALVQGAKASGALQLDEALVTLRMELTAEVLSRLKIACTAAGIRLDEQVDHVDTGDDDEDDDSDDDAQVNGEVDVEVDGAVQTDAPAPPRPRRRRIAGQSLKAMQPVGSSSDSVRLYLREIGRVPLLSAAEEVEIAKRIEAGTVAVERLADMAASGELESLPFQERRSLQREARDHDQATSEMVQANLRLVVSIAKKYERPGMLLLDLIQEGNLGLMRAVQKFDYTKGFKFSTYATWWIRQAITRAIADQARTIRIPVHMVESINKVHRLQRQMLMELEREPTVEELADRADLTPARVREIQTISMDPLSLDKPLDSDGQDSNLADIIGDDRVMSPADAAARQMLNQAVLDALEELNDREQAVMRLRFGLDDGQPRTLEQVGQEFGVTRERIRQIESKTLAKLRHPHRSGKLRDYLEG